MTGCFGCRQRTGLLRYSAARWSRNRNGARLWSKTQPQRAEIVGPLRLVLRTLPPSGKFALPATIAADTDRSHGGYRGDRGMDYTPKVCSPAFRRPEPAKAGTTNAYLSFIQRSRQ
ncbi:MAG: hypothetical protein HY735_04865 [Verrucomicrobia bacterium]|nr:hypothetical protein [Verrucomicrobiota bacterium]